MQHSDMNLVPPQHIAIIMDGNGRWAKQRGLPRTAGHSAGAESFRRIANYCRTLGVRYLTVYAFSTENWKRSQEEVSGIMKLLGAYLREALRDMEKNHVRFRFFGDLSRLNPDLQKLCLEAQNKSSEFQDEVQVNFCLNYGGRDEILRAVRAFAADVAEGKREISELTEEMFSDTVADVERIRDEIKEGIKSVVGIAASIKLVPPKSIQRSEGKAKRTIDKRGLTN